jgi:hypothetical protein
VEEAPAATSAEPPTEAPPEPSVESSTPAEETPAEQPADEAPAQEPPATTPAEPTPAVKEQAAGEPDEAAAIAEFFGEDAEKPATKETPAEKPAQEAPDAKEQTTEEDPEKAAIEAFFKSAEKPAPDDSSANESRFRTWTDRTGQYHLEAKFVALFEDGTVRLQKTNGRWVRLPLGELCRVDQLLVRQTIAISEAIVMSP